MKKGIIWAIVIVSIAAMFAFPRTLLMPGNLMKGHHNLDDKCFSCHLLFGGNKNDKCLACHKLRDIGRDTLKVKDTAAKKEKVRFHYKLSNKNCTFCHNEHKDLNPDSAIRKFNHDMIYKDFVSKCDSCHSTPYDGHHRFLTNDCGGCHNLKVWMPLVTYNHEMIQDTLKSKCSSCHPKPLDEYHFSFKGNSNLSIDSCNACHSTVKWQIPFDISQSRYF